VRGVPATGAGAAAGVRRQVALLVGLVLAVDALFFGVYVLAGLGRAAPGMKLGFTLLWTAVTLAVVLPRLSRIRELRRGR
jgi:hypothetical protein